MNLLAVLLSLWAVAAAQSSDAGDAFAAVAPALTVTIPSVAELRIGASTLAFDLGGDLTSAEMACVYGQHVAGWGGEPPAAGHEMVLPLGTAFRRGAYPLVEVEGRAPVAGFPALEMGRDGGAVARRDEDFVCYRSFLLHHFSNLPGWELTVERIPDGNRFPEQLYIRNSGCSGGSGLMGLVPLYPGQRLKLARSETDQYCPGGDVVVIATTSAGVRAGATETRLIYTLFAPVFE